MSKRAPQSMREERKVITALFADVVGSTVLGERLDPEDVRDIVGRAIGRIVETVESLGGTVKDLAGDGALVLFGAPTVHEDDAERAVRAGLAIVQDIARYADEVTRDWGIEGFGVRVGIETGLVVLGPVGAGSRVEYGATGDAVNTAARLQSHAGPGTVLVGEGAYRIVEPLFDWSPPQTLELKGKAAPVSAWRALGARAVPGRLRGLDDADVALVGRDRELGTIGAAADDLLSGRGGILVVTGEAGLGKSRLLRELRSHLEGRALWLEGRCVSYGASAPYWSFREVLHEWMGRPAEGTLVALERAVASLRDRDLRTGVPFLQTVLGIDPDEAAHRQLANLSSESLQRGIAEAVGGVISGLAEETPVALALEDIHWSDGASLQLAERLLPMTQDERVLVVLASREEDQHPSGRLLGAARAFPGAKDVRLDVLPRGADRELLLALVGEGTLPESVEGAVLASAEGNPLYLEELIRSLVDAGVLRRTDGTWSFEREAPLEIPGTVEKVILARLDRLPSVSREILDAASVIGRRFDPSLLEAVAGGDGKVRRALEDLVRLDLIREERPGPEPEYRFKHVLIQEAAYRSLLKRSRRELHLRVAEALETRFPHRPEGQAALLGRHYRAAGRLERALDLLSQGAREARRAYAVKEALRGYEDSLEVAQELGLADQAVAELHLERGEVRAQTGDIEGARDDLETALGEARARNERALEMRALGELGFLLAGAADYRQAAGFLEEALRLADAASDRAGQVSMLSRLCIVSTNVLRLDRASEFGKRALSLAREAEDERLVAQALDAMKQVVLQLGDASAFEEIADELTPIHERLQDLWLLQFVHFERAYVWAGVGRWEGALDEIRRSLEINRRIGDRGNEALLLSSLGRFHGLRGEYGEALELSLRGTALAAEMGHAEWSSLGELTLGATLLDLHALEEADRHLTQATDSAEIGGALIHLVRAAALLSWCRWCLGDREGAERWAERTEALFTRVTTPPGTAYLPGSDAYVAVARLRLSSGDPARARSLLEPVVAAGVVNGWVEATARGSVVLGRCELALGRTDEAERHLVHAVESAGAAVMPAAELEARTVLTAVYRLQDRREEAAAHDNASRSIIETLSGRIVDESIRTGFVTGALAELEEGSS